MSQHPRAQHGFAAIAAIFLVVVLAALGAFMVTFSNTQQLTSAQDVQGSRAYWAARAGLEWGISKVVADNTNGPAVLPSAPTWPNMPACAATTAPISIEGFNVTVACTCYPSATSCAVNPSVYTDGTKSVEIYKLTATATSTATVGSIAYVERQVSAAIEKCRDPTAPPNYECP
jgi:MSHA biogenesis protein MshP